MDKTKSVQRGDLHTVSKMTRILDLLGDGRWHTLGEIHQKTKLGEGQIHQVMEFLERYSLINMDKTACKVKLDKNVQGFLGKRSSL